MLPLLVQLLEGSPWLQTKPIYVLAMQQPNSEAALTYSLRTRVQQKDAEDQLTKVTPFLEQTGL